MQRQRARELFRLNPDDAGQRADHIVGCPPTRQPARVPRSQVRVHVSIRRSRPQRSRRVPRRERTEPLCSGAACDVVVVALELTCRTGWRRQRLDLFDPRQAVRGVHGELPDHAAAVLADQLGAQLHSAPRDFVVRPFQSPACSARAGCPIFFITTTRGV